MDSGYQISKSIRDLCVFARQDVTKDPPFSGIDLISCRNVLIYLGPVFQKRILPLFHYALKDTGYLLLGESETIGLFADLFAPVDAKHRIYSRKSVASRVVFDFTTAEPVTRAHVVAGSTEARTITGWDIQKEVDRFVLSQYAPPGVVINDELEIVQFRGQTGPYLEPAPGAASFNILKMAREGLWLSLRGAIEEAKNGNRAVQKPGVRVQFNGSDRTIDLSVAPLTFPHWRPAAN